MTTPSADETPYTPPTHFTQVVVAKDVDLDKLTSEVRAKAADAEVSLVAFGPPPYSDQNPATLTVGTIGEGPALDVLNTVVAKHKGKSGSLVDPLAPQVNADPAVAEIETPAPAPAPEPAPEPTPEPTEPPVEEQPAP